MAPPAATPTSLRPVPPPHLAPRASSSRSQGISTAPEPSAARESAYRVLQSHHARFVAAKLSHHQPGPAPSPRPEPEAPG
ncbi:unnamed protein product [Rangifer tarandus platyrhynchus]|uniref:Uncharacterized protein n=1 Tax=Rangifer tarandus platyrhynchus TaxID=3082113 RepID=A0ABN8XSP3_RANTA|nr:unnamed protein product [Rangifer tarandus platyrhynchus]